MVHLLKQINEPDELKDAKEPGGADKQATGAEDLQKTTITHFNFHTGINSLAGMLELQICDLKSDVTADRRMSEQVTTLKPQMSVKTAV